MIVGTAGHIDHGKTTLVRALTGVDTDRLPEEKRRGISIELGYAFVPVPMGAPIGLIDVPGHERLVHTMLAGATGIDAVLLLVAADDGVMPQTREHLAIASLLGIRSGAVVVTKCDRASPERVGEVRRQIAELVAGTPLAQAPVFPTAAARGEGIEPVRQWLVEIAARAGAADATGQAFRLAVDRVFTLAGVGTVVTGSVFSGAITAGDPVQIVPGDRQFRVRTVHAQNQPTRTACAGQRCALNLAGAERSDVERGQWICDPRVALATDRADAHVTVWPAQTQALRSGDDVHLHVGAADMVARVAVLQSDRLMPGQSGYVQLRLRRPIAAWRGDRVVLRDASATRTIAGGQVLDPWPPSRYRKAPERLAQLAALEEPQAARRIEATLQAAPFGVPVHRLQRAWALTLVEAMLPASSIRVGEGDRAWVMAASRWEAVQQQLLGALAQQHAGEPDVIGVDGGRLKRIALPRCEPFVAEQAIEHLAANGRIARRGAFLQLAEHAVRLSQQEERLAQRILPLLQAGDFDPPWVRDLARDLKQPESAVRATLARQAQIGEVFQVVKDLYLHRDAAEKLGATARELAQRSGAVQAAQFRDATGLGRKRAIQILEFFDRIGLLRRVRDAHLLRPGTQLFQEKRTSL
ncbi:MAG TPA: selenocysteine-specific translation elongation factor [Burkholderiaceae bacterium]|jgi:selenocysteine-specific elongation factor|nr:selenocysteine-specific translation elongation factor [Burkholderiaceae bacterium]